MATSLLIPSGAQRLARVPKVPADVPLSSRALDLYGELALPLAADQEFCAGLAHLSAAQASAVCVFYTLVQARPADAGFSLKHLTWAMNWGPCIPRRTLRTERAEDWRYPHIARANEPEPREPWTLCVVDGSLLSRPNP